jgi:protein TonB
MKSISVIVLFLWRCHFFAQNNEPLNSAEQMPEFIGGQDKMMQFISSHLKFPDPALQDSTFKACRTLIKFVVEADGKITKEAIVRECISCPDCDKEAIRVIALMPKWIPGKNAGKPVAVRMALPIFFEKPLKNAK